MVTTLNVFTAPIELERHKIAIATLVAILLAAQRPSLATQDATPFKEVKISLIGTLETHEIYDTITSNFYPKKKLDFLRKVMVCNLRWY